jgi:hypothetical protein
MNLPSSWHNPQLIGWALLGFKLLLQAQDSVFGSVVLSNPEDGN